MFLSSELGQEHFLFQTLFEPGAVFTFLRLPSRFLDYLFKMCNQSGLSSHHVWLH